MDAPYWENTPFNNTMWDPGTTIYMDEGEGFAKQVLAPSACRLTQLSFSNLSVLKRMARNDGKYVF